MNLLTEIKIVENLFKNIAVNKIMRKYLSKDSKSHLHLFRHSFFEISVVRIKYQYYSLISIHEERNPELNEYRLLYKGKRVIEVNISSGACERFRQMYSECIPGELERTLISCNNHLINFQHTC